MMKNKVAAINTEVHNNHNNAAKRSILNYLLLDPEERRRLQISVIKDKQDDSAIIKVVIFHLYPILFIISIDVKYRQTIRQVSSVPSR